MNPGLDLKSSRFITDWTRSTLPNKSLSRTFLHSGDYISLLHAVDKLLIKRQGHCCRLITDQKLDGKLDGWNEKGELVSWVEVPATQDVHSNPETLQVRDQDGE